MRCKYFGRIASSIHDIKGMLTKACNIPCRNKLVVTATVRCNNGMMSDKNYVMRAYKKLFHTKNITQINIGKGQHYSKLNRVKGKLYVSTMYRPRGLIMKLYSPTSSNGCTRYAFYNLVLV